MDNLPKRDLLRVDEVAQYFSVTDRTVRRWVENERLVLVRLSSGGVRITRASVSGFLSGQRAKGLG